jgi:CTP synthase
VDGVLIPGGFGERGIDGMVAAAAWAREHGAPCFGICLGMQVMVIEWARDVLLWQDANSSEFDEGTPHAVVSALADQVDIKAYGGTMRLGASKSVLAEGSIAAQAYGQTLVSERHRHRYEVSNRFKGELASSGLRIIGATEDGELVEAVQWPDHAWGVGVQFHPEFKSKPTAAHPLFRSFIGAVKARSLGAHS